MTTPVVDASINWDSWTPGSIPAARQASKLDEVVVTDTIPLAADGRQCAKVRQLSVAFLFAETIRRISDGESVTSLFAEQNSNF